MAKTTLKFEFAPQAMERLDALKGRLSIKNNAAIFGYGLKILEWFAEQKFQGRKIFVEIDGIKQELELELK